MLTGRIGEEYEQKNSIKNQGFAGRRMTMGRKVGWSLV
jgi:hypothetical protein